jgi:hypothetical protein
MDFRQIVDGGDRLVLIIISGKYAEKIGTGLQMLRVTFSIGKHYTLGVVYGIEDIIR